jgi:hypothetical protein
MSCIIDQPKPGTDQLELIKLNQAAGHWLTDLGGAESLAPGRLPQAVHAVVAQLRALEADPLAAASAPRLRVRGQSGRWLTIHASRLHSHGHGAGIAVIIEPAPLADVAAHRPGARPFQKRNPSRRAHRPWAIHRRDGTAPIHLSQYRARPPEIHLRKTGTHNRRELVSRIFIEEHAPRIEQALDPTARPTITADIET